MRTKEQEEFCKAIAGLLDNAVFDFERNDECIGAVEFAMNVLRKYPNEETVSAMMEAK